MVEPGPLHGREGAPGLRRRVPQLCLVDRIGDVLPGGAPAAARHKHRTVGQEREVVIRARERHRCHLAPLWCWLVHIDHHGARVHRRRGEVGVPSRPALHDPPPLVEDRAVGGDEAVADGGPRLRGHVERPGLPIGPRVEHRPPGKDEEEGVVGVPERGGGERRPGVGRRIIDLRDVGELSLLDGPTDRENPPVGKSRRRRVPAGLGHVAHASPGARGGIEDVGVGHPDEVADVTADDEHAPVGEWRVPRAEEIRLEVRDCGEGIGGGVPDPRVGAAVEFAVRDAAAPGGPHEHRAVRLEHQVDRGLRPGGRRRPLPDRGWRQLPTCEGRQEEQQAEPRRLTPESRRPADRLHHHPPAATAGPETFRRRMLIPDSSLFLWRPPMRCKWGGIPSKRHGAARARPPRRRRAGRRGRAADGSGGRGWPPGSALS